ncbi:unnamed protein product [Ophioblennius macclurei]
MVLKCSTVCLVALALLGSFCEAQHSQNPYRPQKQAPHVSQQEKQTFENPLTWTYPDYPQPEVKPEGPHELRTPVAVQSIAVQCEERSARVEVQKDLFALGQFIDPAHLKIGSCAASFQDPVNDVIIFDFKLQDCESQLALTQDSLIYTFALNYNPFALSGSPVVRTNPTLVYVECHYPRNHNVSSLALEPISAPFSSVKIAEEFLYFSLTLLTEDFLYARPSYQYYLGQTINVEASVNQYFHVPLRVFVDHCVATLSPDASSQPSYTLISDGCMIDARITGSGSKFKPRTSEDKLQFQIDAFKFEGADSGLIYITCTLRAAPVSTGIDETHRACSYNNGWSEASGFDSACISCEPVGIPIPPANPGTGGIRVGSGNSPGSGTTGSTGGTGGNMWGAYPNPGSGTGSGTGSGNRGSGTTGGTGGASGTVWGTYPKPGTGGRKSREAAKKEVFEWQGEVRLGPFEILEKPTA